MTIDFTALIARLKRAGLSFATAESVTGGLLSKKITDVPGCSAVFRGGVVSYQTSVKTAILGVPPDILNEEGPVSRSAARAMAEGVRTLLGVDLAISTTGVAGPDSDAFGRPVGLVYIALAGEDWCLTRELHFVGSRNLIRELTCTEALDLFMGQLEKDGCGEE